MKKTLNWNAIKKRYLQGERPEDLADEYEVTAKQISNKAFREDWTSKREQLKEKIADNALPEIEQVCNLALSVNIKLLKILDKSLSSQNEDYRDGSVPINNPFLMSGEKLNPLFDTALKQGIGLLKDSVKGEGQGVQISGTEAGTVEIVFKKTSTEEDSD